MFVSCHVMEVTLSVKKEKKSGRLREEKEDLGGKKLDLVILSPNVLSL